MATMGTRLSDRVAATGASATGERGESVADRVLSYAAMAGAVGGAVAGAVLGAEVGTEFPLVCGTLGAMLGSGFASGAWCLFVSLWTRLPAGGRGGRERNPAARSGTVTPAPNTG